MTGEPIRIGKVTHNGHEILVVELFGVPLASASSQSIIDKFDSDPGFTEAWSRYFTERIVSMVAEDMQANRRAQGWLMATRLSPRVPGLPTEDATEGEEGS